MIFSVLKTGDAFKVLLKQYLCQEIMTGNIK